MWAKTYVLYIIFFIHTIPFYNVKLDPWHDPNITKCLDSAHV